MLRTLAALTLGLSLCAVAWKLHRQDRELESLRSRIANLSPAEQPPDSRVVCPIVCAATALEPRPDRAAPAPDGPSAAPAPEPLPEPEPISPEEQQANLSAAFDAESADPAWSGPESKRWISVMSELGLSSTEVDGVECRRSLCRAQIRLANDARYGAFLKAAVAAPALRSAGVQSTFLRQPAAADGHVSASMYLSRAGAALPLLD